MRGWQEKLQARRVETFPVKEKRNEKRRAGFAKKRTSFTGEGGKGG